MVVERQGGFVGVPRRGERDGDALTAAQRSALDRVLADPSPAAEQPQPDGFTYKVEVRDGDRIQSVTLPESAMPADLKGIAGP